MKVISIQTTPEDWNKSTLTSIGIENEGWLLSPAVTNIVAETLAEPWLTIWNSMVEVIRAEGQGEWIAKSLSVSKSDAYISKEEIEVEAYLQATMLLEKENYGTKVSSLEFRQKEAIDFFDFWTSYEAWQPIINKE